VKEGELEEVQSKLKKRAEIGSLYAAERESAKRMADLRRFSPRDSFGRTLGAGLPRTAV